MRRSQGFLQSGATGVAASIVLSVALGAGAQNTTLHKATSPQPVVQAFGFVTAGGIISAMPHAPFSAVLVEQMEQTLNDGTNISRDNEETVMRDGMGRIYRARKIKRMGRGATAESENEPLTLVTITDPVQHLQYLCSALRKACTKMEYRQPPNLRLRQAPEGRKMRDVTVEDLGPSNISGVEVEGKRVTRVIPEGMAGNDHPLTTLEETWHSKQLDVDVQVKRVDPRMGTRTTTMTEVTAGEPDPKYFQIPDGYRVEERRFPAGAMAPLAPGGESLDTVGSVAPKQ
jgi:hypothetical protein